MKNYKIHISKSPTADTRTCDWSKVTEEQLLSSSWQHIKDVRRGIRFFLYKLEESAHRHDHTKISHIEQFHKDFKSGFKSTTWWDMHQEDERHHFNNASCIPQDVNLIDILEQIADGIMAGLARSGEYRQEFMPPALLELAYKNTVDLLLSQVVVDD